MNCLSISSVLNVAVLTMLFNWWIRLSFNKNFSFVFQENMKHPEILSQTEYTSIWFRADASFNVPKASVYLHLHLPESYCSPTSAVLTQLFARLISDSLSEVAYPAEVAGLHYGCRSTVSGLLITLSG